MELKRKETGERLRENCKDGVLYFTFPTLEAVPGIVHAFSSRIGGVSEGVLSSMNLGFSRNDDPENVRENFRRIAAAVGFSPDRAVLSDQTHTVNVRSVTSADCGKGLTRKKDYQDVDGLLTDEPGVVLTTFYADCVPLYFVDPVHRAVGLSHSGWRGTVNDIAGVTVDRMRTLYGTRPEDLIAAIGPSICRDCYEVGEDVIEAFRAHYPEEIWPLLFVKNEHGKFQLDLWEACRQNLLAAGLKPQKIAVTDLCTCCNPDVLFSHRASKGQRGSLAAFLALEDRGG